MRAKTLADLLRAGDRVAVSNITGREAATVAEITQKYCGNICAGWALGKAGQKIQAEGSRPVPVFAGFRELMEALPAKKKPNKVMVYSPPEAVYGEVKEVCQYGVGVVETIFIITEHVAVEVTSKIYHICREAGIDVVGGNTLGIINVHDRVRIGAVGGNNPAEAFVPGVVGIVSNSGNMVNTIAGYLQTSGMGISFGCSTGKDVLILTPPLAFAQLAAADPKTRILVMYVEPGGLYEEDLLAWMEAEQPDLPLVVYVAGSLAEGRNLSLGHAGAVVEGRRTSASGKSQLFDQYFGVGPFDPAKGAPRSRKGLDQFLRGIRVTALHHLPRAVGLVRRALGIERDFRPKTGLRLNPWFVNLKQLERRLPQRLVVEEGTIPKVYAQQIRRFSNTWIGADVPRRNMRNASHASGNDGKIPRIYGHSLPELMSKGSFGHALILSWTGEQPRHDFDEALVERCLIAAMTNGPGTISAQGSKLSASAGNRPNTAMIATLASLGTVHGGNGAAAVKFLIGIFSDTDLQDAYVPLKKQDFSRLVSNEAHRFMEERALAKEAGADYRRIPCLGHPVYRNQKENFDPREQVISAFLKAQGVQNVFLDFYHALSIELRDLGVSRNAWAVNVDAAIAAVWLGIAWPLLREKKMTFQRAVDLPFIAFALGRAAGGAAEFLDHQDYGTPMDMRVPPAESRSLVKPVQKNSNS